MDITLTDIETFSSLRQNTKYNGKVIGKKRIKALLVHFVKYLETKPSEKILIRNVQPKPAIDQLKEAKVDKLENEIEKLRR